MDFYIRELEKENKAIKEKQKKLIKEIEELNQEYEILRERYIQLETHLDYLSDSEDEYDEWLGILEEE